MYQLQLAPEPARERSRSRTKGVARNLSGSRFATAEAPKIAMNRCCSYRTPRWRRPKRPSLLIASPNQPIASFHSMVGASTPFGWPDGAGSVARRSQDDAGPGIPDPELKL